MQSVASILQKIKQKLHPRGSQSLLSGAQPWINLKSTQPNPRYIVLAVDLVEGRVQLINFNSKSASCKCGGSISYLFARESQQPPAVSAPPPFSLHSFLWNTRKNLGSTWRHKGEKQERINEVPGEKKHCIVAILPDASTSPFELLSLAKRVVMLLLYLSRRKGLHCSLERERERLTNASGWREKYKEWASLNC